ncbi:MAG: ferrous iron transport protein B [Bacteroidales bacterium]|nr:ferrous iron transport protein B [Bacteroidales bacterium]
MSVNCNGQCSSCPYAAKRKHIKVAVIGSRSMAATSEISVRDYCLRIEFLSEISSILDYKPDVVLNLADSTNLEGTIHPVTKLVDMDHKIVLALERYDEFLATGHSVDMDKLSLLLGMPVLAADFDDVEGKARILPAIIDAYETPAPDADKKVRIPYGQDIEKAILKISEKIHHQHDDDTCFTDRYMAVRLLEKQPYILPYVEKLSNSGEILALADKLSESLRKGYDKSSPELVAIARRGFVSGALQETIRHSSDNSDHSLTQKIDAVLTNRWLGLPILALVLFGMFQATFALGAYPQEWIEDGIGALGEWLHGIMAEGWFSSMLIDGVVQGVGAVLAFLPNIIILFFFLSLLEDSGYMARAAFVMDKIMHRFGLHGRSFIPMLIGFGCNVPAIMAARSIEDRKDRALTMLMIPFMSCSARLPVYMLFVSAFFQNYKALVMMSMYVIGVILSILFAYVMKHTRWFRKENEDYVSELPEYRKPTWRSTGAHIWERASDYLQKISTVILAASVIIWALEYFPAERTDHGANPEQSILADIGRGMEPVMAPLGFDWRMNVCILTGLPAKEAIVSTMGILYKADEDQDSLTSAMREEKYLSGPKAGQNVFTPAVALAFMIFVLLYFPCIATIATLKREIGWKWAAFEVVHSLVLAWVAAFVVFRVVSLLI